MNELHEDLKTLFEQIESINERKYEVPSNQTLKISRKLKRDLYEQLKEIETLARKKFGKLEPNSAFTQFIREIGEILTAEDLESFICELFDIFAFGYAVAMSHGFTHETFISIIGDKIGTVKERMNK